MHTHLHVLNITHTHTHTHITYTIYITQKHTPHNIHTTHNTHKQYTSQHTCTHTYTHHTHTYTHHTHTYTHTHTQTPPTIYTFTLTIHIHTPHIHVGGWKPGMVVDTSHSRAGEGRVRLSLVGAHVPVAVPVSRSLATSEPVPPLHTHTAAYLEGNPTVPLHPSRHSSALPPTTFSLAIPCLPLLSQVPLSCLLLLLSVSSSKSLAKHLSFHFLSASSSP